MSDISTGTGQLKCAWEVRAGVIPGHPMPEHTKRWYITSEVWHRENEMSEQEFKAHHPDGISTFARFCDDAHDYAKSLQDPRYLNWV